MPKVPGVQPGTISGLLLRSPGKKCHSDVAPAEERREYYMGEGGGFPRIQVVVSQYYMGEGGGFPRIQVVVSRYYMGEGGGFPRIQAVVSQYYMGEGGGFPRVRAVVSQVSSRSLVTCPNAKRVQNGF